MKNENDFFVNVAEEDQSADENESISGSENDVTSGSESESGGDGQTNGFFIEEGKNNKSVKLKSNTKIEQAKRKVKQDNRQGQRERKKHAKAVYGKHVQGKSANESMN